jgi:hypothetical protein
MNRLFGKRLRPRVAIGWVILPWKEDHSPVIRELLILRYLKRLLDDVPKVTATAATPRGLHDDGPIRGRVHFPHHG